MKTRATLFWVALFALTVIAYWITGNIERERQRQSEESKRVFDFDPDDVTTLSLERAGKPTIEAMRKKGGAWVFVAPYSHIPAAQESWDLLAGEIALLKNERTIDADPANLSFYGLATPTVTIMVGTEGGQLQQVYVGGPDPTRAHIYARVGGGDVFLTKADTMLPLNQSLNRLRDKRVITLADRRISLIDYTGGYQSGSQATFSISLQRGDDLSWSMVEPFQAILDQNEVAALAREMTQAIGRAHIDNPERLDDYGLAPPVARIHVESGGDSETLILGWPTGDADKNRGGIYAKKEGSPTVFTMDSHILTLIPDSVDDFRERRVFSRRAELLDTIRYEDKRNSFLIKNDPSVGWSFLEPPYKSIDQMAVSTYIALLKRIQGLAFPAEDQAIGLQPPNVRIEFTFVDGSDPTSIEIGSAVPETLPPLFFARQDSGTIVTLSFESVMVLRAQAMDFRNRDLFSFPISAAREIELRFEGRDYRFHKEEQHWSLLEPVDYDLQSQSDVIALLKLLNQTEASAIDDMPPAPRSQGMNDPLLSVTLTVLEGGQGSASKILGPLRVGARITDDSRSRFATVEGRPEVFYVNQSMIDDLRQILHGIVPRR